MHKALMLLTAASALLAVGAKAAPLAQPLPPLAAPHVQAVDWGGGEWRHREWRRHDEWERWRQHEAWERWHRWHEADQRPYGW